MLQSPDAFVFTRLPRRLRRLLHRALDQLGDPRHASGEASGRALRATGRSVALPPLWPAGTASGVRWLAAIAGNVRRRPGAGDGVAGAAGAGDGTAVIFSSATLKKEVLRPDKRARSWRFALAMRL